MSRLVCVAVNTTVAQHDGDIAVPTNAIPQADYERWPLYWFARLEAALEAGDLSQAAEAQERLEDLGLRVELLPQWPQPEASNVG
jgi:hypothetical protein